MTDAALGFDGVKKQYGAVRALDGVSFDVRPGEMFGVIGPDGAGKTTAIRLACGLIRPDGGTVRVFGRDPVTDRRAVTHAIGYLSQRSSLYGDLTVDENVAFFAEIHGVRDYRATRDRLLDMTQLTPFRSRRADRLSGGMKQKLALVCTLVHEPDVVLLDEPTTGVDPVSRREFWKLLSEFLARGPSTRSSVSLAQGRLTIVMATPYLDEAERCGRIALLHDGHVLAVERPGDLQSRGAGQLLEVITDAPRPPVDLLTDVAGIDAGFDDVQAFGDRVHIRVAAGSLVAATAAIEAKLAASGLRAVSVRPIPPSLEDIFIELIAGAS